MDVEGAEQPQLISQLLLLPEGVQVGKLYDPGEELPCDLYRIVPVDMKMENNNILLHSLQEFGDEALGYVRENDGTFQPQFLVEPQASDTFTAVAHLPPPNCADVAYFMQHGVCKFKFAGLEAHAEGLGDHFRFVDLDEPENSSARVFRCYKLPRGIPVPDGVALVVTNHANMPFDRGACLVPHPDMEGGWDLDWHDDLSSDQFVVGSVHKALEHAWEDMGLVTFRDTSLVVLEKLCDVVRGWCESDMQTASLLYEATISTYSWPYQALRAHIFLQELVACVQRTGTSVGFWRETALATPAMRLVRLFADSIPETDYWESLQSKLLVVEAQYKQECSNKLEKN